MLSIAATRTSPQLFKLCESHKHNCVNKRLTAANANDSHHRGPRRQTHRVWRRTPSVSLSSRHDTSARAESVCFSIYSRVVKSRTACKQPRASKPSKQRITWKWNGIKDAIPPVATAAEGHWQQEQSGVALFHSFEGTSTAWNRWDKWNGQPQKVII